MRDRKRTLTGYDHIKPLRQGDLSSLCGIYSAINAARIVAPDLAGRTKLWEEIYALAIAWLRRNRKLRFALNVGIDFDTWKELQVAMFDDLSSRSGRSFRMRPLSRRRITENRELAELVRKAIDQDRAVLCSLSGTLDHFTVIVGYSRARWLLFDSLGQRWVNASVTSFGKRTTTRHWVPRSTLIVLYVAERADDGL